MSRIPRHDDPEDEEPVVAHRQDKAIIAEVVELRRKVELLGRTIRMAAKLLSRVALRKDSEAFDEATYILGVADTVMPASDSDRAAHRKLRTSRKETMTTTEAAALLKVEPAEACSILVHLENSGLVRMDPESARAWMILPVRLSAATQEKLNHDQQYERVTSAVPAGPWHEGDA